MTLFPYAHHFVVSLPPEGLRASLGAARRELMNHG